MDNVLVDFPSTFPKIDPTLLDEFEGRLDEIPGIFSLMEPLKGALQAYETLSKSSISIFFQLHHGKIRLHGLITMSGRKNI